MKKINMLKIDTDNGEGEFKVIKEFKELNNLIKLDIMRDWIWDLKQEYNKTFDCFKKEMEELRNERRKTLTKK
jgi:hypothetical protein